MFIDTLVANALDDLEEDRLDIQTALQTVARLAWQDGYRHGQLPPTGDYGPDYVPPTD
jgi:hypothetical protein